MDLQSLSGVAAAAAMTACPYLGILLVVVFAHEMGHFAAGRCVGAPVETFALGFGREVIGWTSPSGVRWKLCAIPLGGYVRFVGDADVSSRPDAARLRAMPDADRRRLLQGMSPLRRAFVIAAGPAANIALALLVLSVFFFVFGRVDRKALVDSVTPGWPAEAAGVQPGDLIVGVDGQPVLYLRDLKDALQRSGGRDVSIVVERRGVLRQAVLAPRLRRSAGPFGSQDDEVIGIEVAAGENVVVQKFGALSAVREGARETWRVASMTVAAVVNMAEGRIPLATLSGPVKMAHVSRVVASDGGLQGLAGLLAVISVSIALVNLLPIPVLDGGHLLMVGIEVVTRRPISEKAVDMMFRIGLACICSLVLLVTVNDILSLMNAGG